MKQIMFTAFLAKQIREKKKVQTRRLLKLKNKKLLYSNLQGFETHCALFKNEDFSETECVPIPFSVGNELWVREPAIIVDYTKDTLFYSFKGEKEVLSIDMPERFKHIPKWIKNRQGVPNGCIKEMARTKLIITGINVEKLLYISYADLIKEGMEIDYSIEKHERENIAFSDFTYLWDKFSPEGFKAKNNPYVVIYDFTIID